MYPFGFASSEALLHHYGQEFLYPDFVHGLLPSCPLAFWLQRRCRVCKRYSSVFEKEGRGRRTEKARRGLKGNRKFKITCCTQFYKSRDENNNMDTGDNPYSVHVSPDGEVLPPPFIEEERQKHMSRALNDKQKVILQSRQQEEPNPKATSCFDHHSCDACLFNGCAWCIGARRCVDDIPWICKGDHDHVGKVGKLKTVSDRGTK